MVNKWLHRLALLAIVAVGFTIAVAAYWMMASWHWLLQVQVVFCWGASTAIFCLGLDARRNRLLKQVRIYLDGLARRDVQ